jgi:SAM-dependent MidA family methyltransferase
MMTFHDIPKPPDAELKRSHKLSEKIRNKIVEQDGLISFSTFMDMALFDPKLGYYQREDLTLGKEGDFTTAPEISPLFAKCFAMQCKEIWEASPHLSILEIGAGMGRFAKDILTALGEMKCLPKHYYIYEPSLSLRQKQKQLLKQFSFLPQEKITWLEHLPATFKGIIIANEVLDVLPVHCFSLENHVIKERCVGFTQNQFIFSSAKPSTPLLEEAVFKLTTNYAWPNDYHSEINLQIRPFIKNLSDLLTEGVILFADYGYSQDEYYRPDRCNGTLTSFYKHRQYNYPLSYPGLFDITAHVNFTQVANAAFDVGLCVLGFTSQASFLLACGLIDFAQEMEKGLSQKDEFNLHQAIKLLTLPHEMGERCKIMALGKGIDLPLRGFMWQDRRGDL